MRMIVINNSGITRTVFTLWNLAIKFPTLRYGWKRFLQGMVSNINERQWWFTTFDSRLAKIYFADPFGFCVIMERLKVTSDSEFILLFNSEHWNNLPQDIKSDNFGINADGVLKMIDYGS